MFYQQYTKLPEFQFRRVTGVKLKTYFKMVEIIDDFERKKNPFNHGRPHKLCTKDRILATLMYLLEYKTLLQCGLSFGICEATASNTVRDIESKLIQCGAFSLPGKKALYDLEYNVDGLLIDATETRIERPKKRQGYFYSGKKKYHTIKSLVVVNADTLEVICTAFCEGKKHDFELLKDAGIKALETTSILVDSGFQGLQKLHKNTWLPNKKTKNNELTDEQKSENSLLASERVANEHVIGCLKKFSILSCKYRNRRKRFSIRFNLIAGIYNFEL